MNKSLQVSELLSPQTQLLYNPQLFAMYQKYCIYKYIVSRAQYNFNMLTNTSLPYTEFVQIQFYSFISSYNIMAIYTFIFYITNINILMMFKKLCINYRRIYTYKKIIILGDNYRQQYNYDK